MNKREFLKSLKEHLTQMPEEEVSAALRYYEEYFDEAGIENEGRVLRELGSPKQVAKQILADGGIREERRNVNLEHTANKGKTTIWIIIGVIVCIMVLGSIFSGNNRGNIMTSNGSNIPNTSSKSGYTDVDKIVEPFKNIDVEVDMMEVEIVEGESFKVVIHYVASDEMSYAVKNETLTCIQRNTKEIKNRKNSLTIYVPKAEPLGKINISTGMGDSTIENINVDCIVAENGMGDIKATGVSCNKIDIELGMGDAKVVGTVNGDIEIDNGMGDIELQLVGERKNYNYNIGRGMGSIKIDDTKHEGMGDIKENNQADYDITVSNGMGDTEIKFK